MGPTAQHLGVPQFQRDHIETVLLQKPHESRLVSIHHDQIRIDAECVHINPVTTDTFGQVVGVISARVLHRRTIDDLPLFQDFWQRIVVNPSRIAEHQTRTQSHDRRVDMAAEVNIFEEMNPELIAQDRLQPMPPNSLPVALTR